MRFTQQSRMPTRRSSAQALSVAAMTALVLTGCGGNAERVAPVDPIDQVNLCEVKHYGPATSCQPGQKVVFLPASFGNEQQPILFAAINCDLRYQVALTNGAVTCIYAPVKLAANESPDNTPAKP